MQLPGSFRNIFPKVFLIYQLLIQWASNSNASIQHVSIYHRCFYNLKLKLRGNYINQHLTIIRSSLFKFLYLVKTVHNNS